MSDGNKICMGCLESKPLEAFHVKASGLFGRNQRCAECRRWVTLYRRYGITREEYEALAADGCQICGEPDAPNRRLDVDHDHAGESVRGVLCTNCNNGLGRFQDSAGLLRRAIKYLETR